MQQTQHPEPSNNAHFSYNDFHLGDNLFHLHFLRKMAEKYPGHTFTHAAHDCHLPQMKEVVGDVEAISLIALKDSPPWAFNSWKNADGFFQNHLRNWAYYEFYLDWFEHHAITMGLETPFKTMEDLLFDYPALADKPHPIGGDWFDILFINSQPCSGQWLAYDDMEQRRDINVLAKELCAEHSVVVTQKIEIDGREFYPERCTRNHDISVTGIGRLSTICEMVVMIGTGPAWPTCNVHNVTVPRLVLFEPERVNYYSGIRHARNMNEVREILALGGWL